MARPREFDIEEVLDAALDAFWDRGFEATSMADLMNATGLQKGSLYKAFGSKHELFTTALSRYFDDAYAGMQEALEGHDLAVEGVQRWLRLVLACCTEERRRGCFAVNVVVELSPHDEEIADRSRRHFVRAEKLLARTIARGQERGEFRADRSARELAEYLFVFVKGMLTSSKGAHSKAGMQRSAELALEALT